MFSKVARFWFQVEIKGITRYKFISKIKMGKNLEFNLWKAREVRGGGGGSFAITVGR